MNYEVENLDLTVNIASDANISASIAEAQPLAVTFGKSAEIDVGQAVMYIESGKAEVQAAVAEGIADIEVAANNLADKDLSNLSATGEAKFTAKQDVISDLSTIRSGAAAGATAVQPANLAAVATTGAYSDLSGTPSLATVATSGSYADLTGTPDLSVYATNTALNNKADNNAVVHSTTDESVDGIKTFTEIVKRANNATNIHAFAAQHSDIVKGTAPSETVTCNALAFIDKNGYSSNANRLGNVLFSYSSDNITSAKLLAYKPIANTLAAIGVSAYYPSSGTAYVEMTAYLRPSSDNSLNLGAGSYRWKQLYAGTTTISTSDERAKQNIEEISDAVLDAWDEVAFYRFKYKDSVAEKGVDKARAHIGLIAQRIESIFAAHGLNAFDYGLLCFDAWEAQAEEKDEEGNIIKPAREAGNAYALRYEECLCVEAAYQRRRADRIETRLAALEARL